MQAQMVLDNAQRFQEHQRRAQEQQEAFKKAQGETTVRAEDEGGASQMSPAPHEAPAPGAESSSEDRPPVLRREIHAPASTPAGPQPDAEAPVSRPKPELLPGRASIDGVITESKCSPGARLDLTVTAPAETQYLYSDNYFRIPYKALNYTPKHTLNPCIDIKGMRSHIIYHPEKDEPGRGEIIEVQLIK
jgi:hypothetical protein